MTRITKTFLAVLIAAAAGGITTAAAAEDYSSVNATLGDQDRPDYSSVNAALGGEDMAAQPTGVVSSLNALVGAPESGPGDALMGGSSLKAILGSDGLPEPSPVGSPAPNNSDSFDWGDALLGAGVSLAIAMLMALMLAVARRRARVEPSV